jgi:hypothetical protein
MWFNIFLIYLLNFEINNLAECSLSNWLICEEDCNKLLYKDKSLEEKFFLDKKICKYNALKSCHSVNSRLESLPPFDNKCCTVKTPLYEGCLTIVEGRYNKLNLYALSLIHKNFLYDCDGKGYKVFDSSNYIPNEKWEIIMKEKLNCKYSIDEDACKNNPKFFKENIKCCWFTNKYNLNYSSCLGFTDITDEEFNRTIPYISLAKYSTPKGELDFRCYDKNNKVIKGKYNLDLNVSEMDSPDSKLIQELLSEDALNILSKKQIFIKIKDYSKDFNYFHIWTISPLTVQRVFTISLKSFLSNSKRLKVDSMLARCTIENIKYISNLNIATSKCVFKNDKNYKPEKIEILPGYNLLGNFEDNNIAIPGMNLPYGDIPKIDILYLAINNPFIHKYSINIQGKITKNIKNIKFVLYHLRNNDTFKTILVKGSYIKDIQRINFSTEESIYFNEGLTIIPNQLCKSDDGEYLFIENVNKNNKFNYYKIGNIKINAENFSNSRTKRKRITTLKIVGIIFLSIILLIIIGFLLAILKAKFFDNFNLRN